MTSGAALIDTSAWIEAMRQKGDEHVRTQVETLVRQGRARFCDLVRLELWNGIGGHAERRWLSEMEEVVETVPTDDQVWMEARRLALAARPRGLTVPATDLLIAACARIHGLDLVHRDSHFDLLSGILEGIA